MTVQGATSSSQPAGVFCLEPKDVEAYGAGCPAADGRVPALGSEGIAARGGRFGLLVARGPAHRGTLLLGAGRRQTPVLGCEPYVSTVGVAVPWTLDGKGGRAFG